VEKEIDTHRKQQEKQIMSSMIMLCFNEPFSLYLKAKNQAKHVRFSHMYKYKTIYENNRVLIGSMERFVRGKKD
jgi:hypothetical protein